MNNRVIACACLGGAFILSLQRYFPTKGGISLGRMAIDVTILTIAMTGGLVFASNGIDDDVYTLKKPLVIAKNPQILEHMTELNRMYGFPYQQQVFSIFGNDKHKLNAWMEGKNPENPEAGVKSDSVA